LKSQREKKEKILEKKLEISGRRRKKNVIAS